MKDPLSYSDYRTKYKKYYGINFNSKKYVIHHMDLNHDNNDIENLLLLPRELHAKYHSTLLKFRGFNRINGHKDLLVIDVRLTTNLAICFESSLIDELYEVMNECSLWIDYRSYLQGIMPNIHNIVLEE